mmetsp:Transcript_15179/g.44716  ORF Transcript_15179/g.44716 Transcript_15179/m.44716 type:complete len:224 (+) Transcript_15179:332-1003(+)
MAFFLARQRASFLLARRSALAIRYPIRCRLYCTRSPVRASNVDSVGLSCPMNNVHALFDEDRHKRIALRIFSDAMSPFSQNPKCFLPPTCIVSYHPAPRLPGQFWRSILGFGTRFASLWVHPLPMLNLSQILVCSSFHFARWLLLLVLPQYLVGHQAGACSEAMPHPSDRVRHCYAFGATRSSLTMCKSMRRSCKTGWIDGCVDGFGVNGWTEHGPRRAGGRG